MTVLCTVCFGLTMMESVAVTKPVNLLSCAAASVVFFSGGSSTCASGCPLAAANLVGGWLGAHAALKGGDSSCGRCSCSPSPRWPSSWSSGTCSCAGKLSQEAAAF